jgi:hypothetical protein
MQGAGYDPNRSAEPLGGPRAGGNWPGGEVAPPTWARIFRTVTLSSMHAMIFTAPPQCSQTVHPCHGGRGHLVRRDDIAIRVGVLFPPALGLLQGLDFAIPVLPAGS